MLGITSNVAFSWLMFSRQSDYESLITGDVISSCGCSGTYFERSSKGLDHGINLCGRLSVILRPLKQSVVARFQAAYRRLIDTRGRYFCLP